MPKFFRITALVSASCILLSACGAGSKSQRKDTSTDTQESGPKTLDGGIDLRGLAFGPYLAAAPSGFATKQLSLEFGYLDVREQQDGSKTEIADYRFKQATAYAKTGHLPAKVASGCVDVEALGAGDPAVKSVKFTGAAAGDLAFADGRASLEGKDGEVAIQLSQLTATVSGLGAKDVVVKSPNVPTVGSIQLGGAIDALVTVNNFVSGLTSALEESDDDLQIADVGDAKDYNLVVLTFYPGEAAQASVPLRCYLKPEGKATLKKSAYAKLLPLSGIIGHFANVQVTTTDDVTVWSTAIAGQGAEDLTVK